ncbi:spore maturation protein cgeB [Cohnella faecalis]|uniref:Spore maturation protein cgeB n=2 Tax=Cohnella faecalis TaxID=2315694 RepID=A0A398CQZ1_9BACL|nr:spore maturation protein cgeB [Cohnella faecalis]
MFVATGKGYPYSPLDAALHESLMAVTEKVTYVTPQEDIAGIAAYSRPDLMFVLDGLEMPIEKVQAVRALNIRTAVWFTDDPYYTDDTSVLATCYDIVFTLERNCVDFYKERGCSHVHYLPMGVFPGHFRPRNPPMSERCDIRFIGTAFWNRVNWLHETLPLIEHRNVKVSGLWWDRLPDYSRWQSKIELDKWMEPGETAQQYNASRIVLNSHRAYDDDTVNRSQIKVPPASPNPRMFEIAACGTLQLTDWREDISLYYAPGLEIVTYDSPQDLAEKAKYYLENEEERQQIALRALYRTMKEHTYVSRFHQLLDMAFAP